MAFLISPPATAECPGITATVQPRLSIPLFRYAGTEDGEAKSHFSRFQAVIAVKLIALAGEFLQPDVAETDLSRRKVAFNSRLEYLSHLALYVPEDGPIPDSLNTLAKRDIYWRRQNALALLRGELWPGQPHFVDSRVFIGDLRGRFPASEIHVRMPIQPELVPSTNDSHSLVTYYALAMDARQLKCDPAIVRSLLSRAWSVLQDLKRRDGGLVGDLGGLEPLLRRELELGP